MNLTFHEIDRVKLCFIYDKEPIVYHNDLTTQVAIRNLSPSIQDLEIYSYLSACKFNLLEFFRNSASNIFNTECDIFVSLIFTAKHLGADWLSLLKSYEFLLYSSPYTYDLDEDPENYFKAIDAYLNIAGLDGIDKDPFKFLIEIVSLRRVFHRTVTDSSIYISRVLGVIKSIVNQIIHTPRNNPINLIIEYIALNCIWLIEQIDFCRESRLDAVFVYSLIVELLSKSNISCASRHINFTMDVNRISGLSNIDSNFSTSWALRDQNVKYFNIRPLQTFDCALVTYNMNFRMGDVLFELENISRSGLAIKAHCADILGIDSGVFGNVEIVSETNFPVNSLRPGQVFGCFSDIDYQDAKDFEYSQFFQPTINKIEEGMFEIRNYILLTVASPNRGKKEYLPCGTIQKILDVAAKSGVSVVLWQHNLKDVEKLFYGLGELEKMFNLMVSNKFISNLAHMADILYRSRGCISVSCSNYILARHLKIHSLLLSKTMSNKFYRVPYSDAQDNYLRANLNFDDYDESIRIFFENLPTSVNHY